MLAIITDDFTGASEIAGVSLDKGFRTVIETRIVQPHEAEVLVIATGMRSLAPADAAAMSAKLTAEILALNPTLVFKKVDSVLRGNIGPELEAQMRVEQKPCALLIPANPSRSRTIADGVYFVDGTPIAESGFAHNRNLAPPTSNVVDILRNRGASNAVCISPNESMVSSGIHIGNTRDDGDLKTWARKVDDRIVPAGAADFFAAVLDASAAARKHNGAGIFEAGKRRTLYVCGSNFPSSRQAVSDARLRGAGIVAMPDDVYFSKRPEQSSLDVWALEVLSTLARNGNAIIAALQAPADNSIGGAQISTAMAEVVRQVVDQQGIDDLMIEGGATSEAVMSALRVDCLYPSQSVAPGVTRMRVDGYPGLYITMKPGSYRWPASIWEFKG